MNSKRFAFEKRIPFLEETRATAAAESFPEDRKLTPEKALEKQQKIKLKRGERLDKTVGQQAKYLSGTDAFPFHHIMPIGGEAQLTTNDVAVISKQMNTFALLPLSPDLPQAMSSRKTSLKGPSLSILENA